MTGTISTPEYNHIYSRLVASPNDIIGIIAYSLYKQQKIEWITRLKERHQGNDPKDVELESFHDMTNTESALVGYRRQAKEILDEYLSQSIEQATNDISDSYDEILQTELQNVEARYAKATSPLIDKIIGAAKTEISSMKPSFWSGVVQNVLANVVILVITAFILIVLWSLKTSPAQVLGDIFGYEVKEKPAATAQDKRK